MLCVLADCFPITGRVSKEVSIILMNKVHESQLKTISTKPKKIHLKQLNGLKKECIQR